MAIISLCSSCFRALQPQRRPSVIHLSSRISRLQQKPLLPRAFTSSPYRTTPQPTQAQKLETPHSSSTLTNVASSLRRTPGLRGATEQYIAYGGTEQLYQACSRQCTYTIPSALANPPGTPPMNEAGDHLGEGSGWWFDTKARGGLELEVTFNSWAQVMFLHMWMLTVRLRCFPAQYVKEWHQNLLDHFFYAAEDRMATWHGMVARGVRNKNLKDLWIQWRGVQLGYDEGLSRGDAVFATAVWRNLFKASPAVNVADMALVTAYAMKALQRLGSMDDADIIKGAVVFENASTLADAIQMKSPSMNLEKSAGNSRRQSDSGKEK